MDNSSFSRLPTELIRKIFFDCLPDESSSTSSFEADDAPLLLSHVCRSWSSIVEETPLLWSCINIPRWSECPGNLLELVNLWISRSRDVPLSVNILLFHEDWEILVGEDGRELLGDLMRDILALLEPHRTRIKSLSGNFPKHADHLIGIPEMANIENLTYYRATNYDEIPRIPENFDAQSTRVALNLGPTKEKLRVLRIADCVVDVDSIVHQTQLTHLEIYHSQHASPLCQETAFHILNNLPNLRKCVMELGRNERLGWNGPSKRVVLSNLESLCLIWRFPADTEILLNSLSTPNLVRLRLRGTPTSGMGSWKGLYHFLEVSQPELRYLYLEEFQDIDIHLLESLRLTRRLTHLVIRLLALPSNFLPSLTRQKGDNQDEDAELLPYLENLHLSACTNLKYETLAAFLESRARGVSSGFSRLREVEIDFCSGITKDAVPTLQQRYGLEKLAVMIR